MSYQDPYVKAIKKYQKALSRYEDRVAEYNKQINLQSKRTRKLVSQLKNTATFPTPKPQPTIEEIVAGLPIPFIIYVSMGLLLIRYLHIWI
jgi:hypothetical protein